MKFALLERKRTIRRKGLKVRVYARVVQIPKDLSDAAQICTPRVFREALGKVFRIQGFDQYGCVELNVTKDDTIWIEPEFLVRVERKRASSS